MRYLYLIRIAACLVAAIIDDQNATLDRAEITLRTLGKSHTHIACRLRQLAERIMIP